MDTDADDEPSLNCVERQVWFGPADRPLYGWLAIPKSGKAGLGVVLCSPVGEEGRASHRTFRTLSRTLADRGALALRFDYDGTGDSAGRLSDPDRLTAWLGDIGRAAELLRKCGVQRISVVGMRLGATLAAWLAADAGSGQAIESLVLWDACASGRSFLREGQTLHALGEGAGDPAPDNAIDTPGFRFSAAAAGQLRPVDLAKLAQRRLASRVLVLEREDRPLPNSARERLSAEPVEWQPALGQHELLDVLPSDSQVPVLSLNHVVDWVMAPPNPAPAASLTIPDTLPALIPSADTYGPVREHSVRLGSANLYGIVTEGEFGASGPWVVLINVAAEHHIGPGRLWVEFARRWASLGFRVIRLDQRGIGDSPTRSGDPDDVAFAPIWISDLPEIVDQLRANGSKIGLVGLCSGAYSAMEAALHTDVDAICALNPRLTIREATKVTPNWDPDRRAARPPAKPFARLGRRYPLTAGGMWRIYRQFAFWHAPITVLADVVKRGTNLMVIVNPKDGRAFREVVVWGPILPRRLARTGRYSLRILPRMDHSLLTQSAQELAADLVTAYLVEHFARDLEPAAPHVTE